MSTVADLKAEHLAAAEERWNDAVAGAMRFFHYENKSPGAQGTYYADPKHIKAVRAFARRFLEVDGMVRFYLLGGPYYGRPESQFTYYNEVSNEDPCSLLEFLRFFIGHELLDDGEPGLAFHKRSDSPDVFWGWEPCGPDDPDAEPWFHRSIDHLREDYPDAQWLSVELALEVLNAADEKHRAFEERFNKLIEKNPGVFDHRDKREPSKRDLQLRDLAHELARGVNR